MSHRIPATTVSEEFKEKTENWRKKHNLSNSELVRLALANLVKTPIKDLKYPPRRNSENKLALPEFANVQVGNPDPGSAAKARWKKKTAKKKVARKK